MDQCFCCGDFRQSTQNTESMQAAVPRPRGRRANTSHSTRTSANASRCGGTLPPGVGAGAQAVQATPLSLYMLSTREIFLPQNPEGGWPTPVPTCAERAPPPERAEGRSEHQLMHGAGLGGCPLAVSSFLRPPGHAP
jgi:hypothetical protein